MSPAPLGTRASTSLGSYNEDAKSLSEKQNQRGKKGRESKSPEK